MEDAPPETSDSAEEQASSPGRGRSWGLLALVGGAVGLAAWGFSRDRSSSTPTNCETASASIDGVWNEATAAEVVAAFESTELPFASTTVTRVQRDLDAHADRWRAAVTSVCEDEESSPGRIAQRNACLEGQLGQLQAFVDVLRDGDPSVVERAGFATAELPPLEDCGQVDAVASDVPDDADTIDALAASVTLGRGTEVADEIADLLEAKSEGPDPKRARALFLGGRVHLSADRPGDAADMLEQAVWALLEAGNEPATVDAALALALATARSGETATEAQRWWRLASALTTKLGSGLERQRRLLSVQAELLRAQGQWSAALSIYEPALSLTEKRWGAEHPAMVAGLVGAAECAARLERGPESLKLYDRARTIVAKSLGHNHPRAREIARAHGSILLEVGRADLALPELQASLENIPGPPTRGDVAAAIALGRAAAVDDPSAAEAAFDRAEQLHEESGLSPAQLLPSIHLGRGLVHLSRNDARAALSSFRTAQKLETEHGGSDSSEVAEMSVRIGRALASLGRVDEAQEVLASAAELAERSYGAADPRTAEIWLAQAEVEADRGDPQAALDLARRALAQLVQSRGPNHPATLVALTQIGSTCLALGRDADAVASFEQAVAVARAGTRPGELASAQLGLATALWKQGDRERSLAVVGELRKTIEASGSDSPVTAGDVDAWMKRRGLSM